MVPRENENNAYAKFWRENNEYYGIFESGPLNLIPFVLTYFTTNFHLFLWFGRDHHERGITNIVRSYTISVI